MLYTFLGHPVLNVLFGSLFLFPLPLGVHVHVQFRYND
jgi:hypothetical protein